MVKPKRFFRTRPVRLFFAGVRAASAAFAAALLFSPIQATAAPAVDGDQMKQIIERIVPVSAINYDRCTVTRRSQQAFSLFSKAGYGCQEMDDDGGAVNFDLGVTLKIDAHPSAFCDKPYSEKIDEDRIGDKACGLIMTNRTGMDGGSTQFEFRYEIFDALDNGEEIGVSVKVRSYASAGRRPVDSLHLSQMATHFATRLYGAFREVALGGPLPAADGGPPPSGESGGAEDVAALLEEFLPGIDDPPPPESGGVETRILTIVNETDTRLDLSHYFEDAEGGFFEDGPGRREFRVDYPADRIAPHVSQSFQADLHPGRNRLVLEPAYTSAIYLDGERIGQHSVAASAIAPATVRFDVTADQTQYRFHIRPGDLRPASPDRRFPADLYVENNLDITVNLFFADREPGAGSEGDGIIGIVGELLNDFDRRYTGRGFPVPPGGTLLFDNMSVWPGSNWVKVRLDGAADPARRAQSIERKFTVPDNGPANLDRRFQLIITEQDFTP